MQTFQAPGRPILTSGRRSKKIMFLAIIPVLIKLRAYKFWQNAGNIYGYIQTSSIPENNAASFTVSERLLSIVVK